MEGCIATVRPRAHEVHWFETRTNLHVFASRLNLVLLDFTTIMSVEFQKLAHKFNELLQREIPFVTVTLCELRGSAPQIQGAKAIVTNDGIELGTVGGGKVEARAITHAQGLLENENATSCDLQTWNLQTDIGMTCGGEVKILFEVFRPTPWFISVFGAGHIAQCLVPTLLSLNCKVTCLDNRQDWLDKLSDHPKLTKVFSHDLEQEVTNQPDQAFFVLMTQGHATDLPVLRQILETRDAPYVGVIGSLQKAKVLRRDLTKGGLPSEKMESFFCPMGHPLGNNTPPEIAISVTAQLIQERDRLKIFSHRTKEF